jgi:hypothetical protein
MDARSSAAAWHRYFGAHLLLATNPMPLPAPRWRPHARGTTDARFTTAVDRCASRKPSPSPLPARVHAAGQRAAAAPQSCTSTDCCARVVGAAAPRRRSREARRAASSGGRRDSPSPAVLVSSAARSHQPTVQTGSRRNTPGTLRSARCIASQLCDTRATMSENSSTLTTYRPHATCGSSRPKLSIIALELREGVDR